MKAARLAWLALLALGVAALGWQALHPGGHSGDGHHGHTDDAPDLLLPEGLATAQVIEIRQGEQVTRFERGADARWFRHAHAAAPGPGAIDLSAVYAHRHRDAPADANHRHDVSATEAERIGEALATFSRTRIERWIAQPPQAELAPYGLVQPQIVVLVFGATPKPMLTLEVGAVAPDGLGRFVKLRERASLAIVAGFQIDKLVALAAAGS